MIQIFFISVNSINSNLLIFKIMHVNVVSTLEIFHIITGYTSQKIEVHGIMAYRSSMQIMSAVLENVDYAGTEGLGITQIIRKSNLSHVRLQNLIQNLTGSGLINKIEYDKKSAFVITEKGRLFLEEYKRFSDLAGSFGLEL